jgi:hypothetical protein
VISGQQASVGVRPPSSSCVLAFHHSSESPEEVAIRFTSSSTALKCGGDGMSPGRGMIGPATSPHGQDGGVIPTLVRSQSPPEIRDSALGEGPSRPSPHADPPAKAPAIAMALWERSKGLRLIPSSALVRVGRSRIGPHGDPHRHRRPDPAANGEGQLRLGTSRSGQP